MESENSQRNPDYKRDESSDRGGKRYRRTANEIERRFTCWCGKAYGSEGSLNQHKKIKGHYDAISSKQEHQQTFFNQMSRV